MRGDPEKSRVLPKRIGGDFSFGAEIHVKKQFFERTRRYYFEGTKRGRARKRGAAAPP